MERLNPSQIASGKQPSSGIVPQPPIWQKAISKMQTWLRIQPKLLTSPAVRMWLEGVRLCVTGDTAKGVAALRQAADTARKAGDPAALITALGFYSNICIGTGDYLEAEQCAVEGLPLKSSAIFPRSVGFLYSSFALSWLYRDAPVKAITLVNEGLSYSKTNGYAECESWLNSVASLVWLDQGDAFNAYQCAFNSIALGQRSGVIDMLSYATAMCGLALAHLRDYDKARLYLKESVSDVSAFSDVWGKTFGWLCYGDSLLLAGNADAARDCFNQGLDLAEQIEAPPHAARAQFGLARVALAQGNREVAQAHASRSFHGYDRLGDVRAKSVAWWMQEQLNSIPGDE